MLSPEELAIQTSLTQWFIEADSETLTMLRRQRVRNPDTGALEWREAVPVDPPVVVKLQPTQYTTASVPEVQTPGGEEVWPELTMLALPGTDIQKDDVFDWRGNRWRIDELRLKPDYEIIADVNRYAGS